MFIDNMHIVQEGSGNAEAAEHNVLLKCTSPEDARLYCAALAIVLARYDGGSEVAFHCLVDASGETIHARGDGNNTVEELVATIKPQLEKLKRGSSGNWPEHDFSMRISGLKEYVTQGNTEFFHKHLDEAVVGLRTASPSTKLHDLNFFSTLDRQQILKWNPAQPPCIEETLCGLFAHQVQIQPHAQAVYSSLDGTLTYAELDVLSNKIAAELVRRAVKEQEAVALCFDKSALAIVVMLGVLKAGAFFVNLGISLPAHRQAAILAACKAPLLIVDHYNKSRLDQHPALPALLLADINSIKSLPDPPAIFPPVKPSYAAAITFTSGSTGTPKGIVVEHGSIATSCNAIGSRLDIGPHTRILQFASYTFDASVGDIFYALMRGAVVCSPSEYERVNSLAEAARSMRVNWAFLTPSVLSLLQPSEVPSLKRLLCGGEPPSPKHIDLWSEKASVHLMMGPAECAIYCAASDAMKPGEDTSTFGRAEGCCLWVVDPDDHKKLAPIGVPGELIVEGRIVARGYLNDAERSKQVFLEADQVPWLPTRSTPSRLYKSGDLVRFNADKGTFSFVARKDNQVKLHGQRVELNEIEHHLKAAVAEIDSAIVVLNTSADHIQRHPLIAFLVFDKHSAAVKGQSMSLTTEGVEILRQARQQLETVLPTYMIPSLFVPIQNVPFTLSGKRDTSALRSLVQQLSPDDLHTFSLGHQTDAPTRPMTDWEEKLRDLWVNILHVAPDVIRLESDFIREGGDSLASMHLATRAMKQQLYLPVSAIIANPRLSDMASVMTQLASQAPDEVPDSFSLLHEAWNIEGLKTRCAAVCETDIGQIEDIYPTTPPQAMLWGASQINKGTYILRLQFQLPGSVPLQTFMSAWNKVVQSADVLRARFVADTEAGLVNVIMKDFDWDIYEDMEDYERRKILHMTLGCRLARLAIILNSDGKTPVFVFTANHCIYDAWMLNMIFDKVGEIVKTGRGAPFSPFKNYVAFRERQNREVSLLYWKENLEGSPAATWPVAPRPGNMATKGSLATQRIRKHVKIAERPKEFTLGVIAQAAYTLLSSEQMRSDDVIFCMTFSGRDAGLPSVLNIPGPTLFTVPFRTKINRKATLYDFFDLIRQSILTISQYGHIGLPSIRTVSEAATQACDFRALFAVQPRHLEAPEDVFGPRIDFQEEMGRLALIFECWIVDGGVDLNLEYNVNSLDWELMESMVNRFSILLPSLIAAPPETILEDFHARAISEL